MSTAARKIVVAVDPSDQAEQAFQWYLSTVHRPENEVILLFINVTSSAAESSEDTPKKEPQTVKSMEDKYNGWILEKGISGRMRTESGSKKGETICRVAEEEDATMIIVGTRGLGKVRRTIMGSVSDYVVHHAPCPVIVCRQIT
ncbi:hypothetical protein HELRODRAFT_185040 [Helobdella robusta]|uniref:UspA domain-containing protein n=1 Tax=Helobdella robusta TaxID=6412 RepID=T1FMB6_HELRO|nr:hypothetical protein HELRODRAFT_185040 [Helobdella robusta]ESN98907.1 hypothetical protein HELRODRAFT_185040 [Helobdella robusta]